MSGKTANKQCSQYSRGRPAKMANGGKVEGVSQRKAIAMGGASDGKHVAEQNKAGGFQRRK